MITEVPNNNKQEFMMDFKKFSQMKGLIYSEDRVWIKGSFKEEGSDKVISGDDFWADIIHTSGKPANAKEIYKTYLEWFNRTRRYFEKGRIYVSAKIVKKEHLE